MRRAALDRFGETAIRRATPLALMEEALVPLFLHHRYQVEAAASALGGQHYAYALRGDGRAAAAAGARRRAAAALDALAATLRAVGAGVPPAVLDAAAAAAGRLSACTASSSRAYTGLPFDPVTPGLVAADLTLTMRCSLDRRAPRLVSQHAFDATLPSFGDVVDRLVAAMFDATAGRRLRGGSESRGGWRARRSADRAGRRCADAAGAGVRDRRASGELAAAEGDAHVARRAGGARQLLQADIARFLTGRIHRPGRRAADGAAGGADRQPGPTMVGRDDAGAGWRRRFVRPSFHRYLRDSRRASSMATGSRFSRERRGALRMRRRQNVALETS